MQVKIESFNKYYSLRSYIKHHFLQCTLILFFGLGVTIRLDQLGAETTRSGGLWYGFKMQGFSVFKFCSTFPFICNGIIFSAISSKGILCSSCAWMWHKNWNHCTFLLREVFCWFICSLNSWYVQFWNKILGEFMLGAFVLPVKPIQVVFIPYLLIECIFSCYLSLHVELWTHPLEFLIS